MSRVLVCGGRDYADSRQLRAVLDGLKPAVTVLIEGGATGADHQAAMWAQVHGVERECYAADWWRFGNRAGPIRNQRMLDEGKPDLVIAFPGGRGLARSAYMDMIDAALQPAIDGGEG